ncbi:MAG TPA: type II toxin-antitoxin system VapC family toxin [Saprospiraceae bacterium]|nr:type II toxin-antitoxin system VapC family toxin [Saprospiraceae bacterium]
MGRIKYLLDTHTLLWFFYRKELLPQQILEYIQNENIFVSAVNFWEISIKYNKGNLDLLGNTPYELKMICFEKLKFDFLELDIETTSSFYNLTINHHSDPFDRMLIWQALTHDLTIMTNDTNIHKYQDIGLKVIW